METRNFLFSAFLVLVLFFSGCIESGGEVTENPTPAEIQTLQADRPLYHSAEVMNISVVVYSSTSLENVNVTLTGVNNRINELKVVNLTPGENSMLFTHQLPSCNTCGGIKPNNYDIYAIVEYDNVTVKKYITINIQQ